MPSEGKKANSQHQELIEQLEQANSNLFAIVGLLERILKRLPDLGFDLLKK